MTILLFADGACDMKKVSIAIDDYLYAFYRKVGETAGGIRPEQVMADALFKLAGELALNAIDEKGAQKHDRLIMRLNEK